MTDTLHSVLFSVGLLLLVGALAVGVGAFEYEVRSLGTAAEIPADATSVVLYDDLSARDRRIVDRAIAGERFVFQSLSDLPGPREIRGKLAVLRGEETYVLARRIFFNWRTTHGASAIALAITGAVAVGEAIRRHHFPHRTVFWTR